MSKLKAPHKRHAVQCRMEGDKRPLFSRGQSCHTMVQLFVVRTNDFCGHTLHLHFHRLVKSSEIAQTIWRWSWAFLAESHALRRDMSQKLNRVAACLVESAGGCKARLSSIEHRRTGICRTMRAFEFAWLGRSMALLAATMLVTLRRRTQFININER